MAEYLFGKEVADKITEQLQDEVDILRAKGIIPKLEIIRLGENPEDLAYERGAINRMKRCSISVAITQLPREISHKDFMEKFYKINDNSHVHGILLLKPLPSQIIEKEVNNAINPIKDIDGMHPLNMAKIMAGDDTGMIPCTPKAVLSMLDYYNINLEGKKVVIVGRSLVFGKPASMLCLNKNATVTVCHSRTKNLQEECAAADILIVAIGKSKMITADYVKDGAVVIDVGINVDEEGNLCGDVETESVYDKCSAITPVPKGVGSVTTTMLAEQVIKGAKIINKLI
jgi:methylenetetrahydrofolate dehydrogenase (NADP+)/methenyltetrahydrofolate cyclohydrolase